MENEYSLLYSEAFTTYPYPEPDQFSPCLYPTS